MADSLATARIDGWLGGRSRGSAGAVAIGLLAVLLTAALGAVVNAALGTVTPAANAKNSLAIARQLCELHGGSIQAESPGIGLGSTFTLEFSRCPATGAPVSMEDDDDARALVVKVLESQSASVKAVASAREALDVLTKERVDVLLSDIEMPGTDGYQRVEELRLRPSQQGGSVPAAALITVVANRATRRG